jgi:hypothetical protein
MPPGIPQDIVLAQIESAFSAWSRPTCSAVVFEQSGMTIAEAAPGDDKNTIQFVYYGWAERGFDTTAAAVADVQYAKSHGQWEIVEADLYLNADGQEWDFGSAPIEGKNNFDAVAVHESGHLLGLMHPCELPSSPVSEFPTCPGDASPDVTMHPVYSVEHVTLAQDDVDGVCFLYPGVACDVAGCGPDEICTDHGCKKTCGDSYCESDKTCIEGKCVDPNLDCAAGTCSPCDAQHQCPHGETCEQGECIGGDAELGDPCADDEECWSGVCSTDSYCTAACADSSNCPGDDWTCESGAKDCIGNQCVGDLSPTPLCTRLCVEGSASCPLGWNCELVEGRSVCTPPAQTNCGCRLVGTDAVAGRGNQNVAGLLVVGAIFLRRCRARIAKRSS